VFLHQFPGDPLGTVLLIELLHSENKAVVVAIKPGIM
jgi:hypothetical protein